MTSPDEPLHCWRKDCELTPTWAGKGVDGDRGVAVTFMMCDAGHITVVTEANPLDDAPRLF